jgi:hypothetical protein
LGDERWVGRKEKGKRKFWELEEQLLIRGRKKN